MKHNQFAYKLINGKVTNKFCRIENKITYSYLDKNGNKKVDYNERKIRIQNERKNIERNIINDLYLALGWNNSGLKQNVPIGKYTPDFFDSNKKNYFEITETNNFDYDNKEKEFSDFLQHPVIAKINQQIKDNEKPLAKEHNILSENFKKSILKKNTIYNGFNEEINLIVYCIDEVFPYHNAELYKEIIMSKIKNKISNNFIEFKPTNDIFSKIFLVLINQINDEQYYYSVVIIDYK